MLEALAVDQRDALAQRFVRRRHRRGEAVFFEGERGDTLHLVESGYFVAQTSTAEGNEITLSVIGPGEVFGELALLGTDPVRTATIVALRDGVTLALLRRDFEQLRKREPGLDRFLVEVLADQVGRLTRRALENAHIDADTRVIHRLRELVDVYGSEEIPLTQEQIAHLAATTRPTVNRTLRRLEDQGAVRLQRGRLRVIDVSSLSV